MFLQYPSLYSLAKVPEILSVDRVVATEKLHGSNFRIHLPPGADSIEQIGFGGRREEFDETKEAAFYAGEPVRWFRQRPELLQRLLDYKSAKGWDNVVVYGEVCSGMIQGGLLYEPDGKLIFRAFDVLVGEDLRPYDELVELCDSIDLPRVTEVWRGPPSESAFDALLEQPSPTAIKSGVSEPKISEGVIVRADPLRRAASGRWLIIKHKSARFREEGRKRERNLSPLESFVQTYVVPGRIINAIGRLKDRGVELTGSMQDMRFLGPEIIADLHKECGDEWNALSEDGGQSDKTMSAAVTKQAAMVYRRELDPSSPKSP